MSKLIGLLLPVLLLACGDNIQPPGPGPSWDGHGPVANPCGTFRDWGGTGETDCDPDLDEEDYDQPDGSDPDGDDQGSGTKKSACCIGALKGKVPHECGPPPGTCKFDSICEGVALYLCTP